MEAANPPLACLAASAHDTASPTTAFSERWEATYSRSSLSPSLPLADEVNGGSGNHRIVLVHELCERVVQIARAAFQDGVRVADLFGQRRVVQDRHHAFAHDATEQIIEILDRRCAATPSPCSIVYLAAATSST